MTQSSLRRLPLTLVGLLILAVVVFPVYWMINSSLQTNGGGVSSSWIPVHLTFSGYQTAFVEQGHNLVTSILVSLGAVVVTLIIATPAAYALAKFKLRWTGVIVFALLITQMIPGIVVANALYTAYNDLGLLNNLVSLIFADAAHSLPFAIVILRAFMISLPDSLVEAALIDGATQLRAFISIVVPLSINSLITVALFSFLFAWGDLIFALTLTTSDKVRPITLGIYGYLQANVEDWAPVMAASVMAMIPALIFLAFAQRYIAAGVLSGSLK